MLSQVTLDPFAFLCIIMAFYLAGCATIAMIVIAPVLLEIRRCKKIEKNARASIAALQKEGE
jgi:hypothetical protein